MLGSWLQHAKLRFRGSMEEALRVLFWELEMPGSVLSSGANWLCKSGQII